LAKNLELKQKSGPIKAYLLGFSPLTNNHFFNFMEVLKMAKRKAKKKAKEEKPTKKRATKKKN